MNPRHSAGREHLRVHHALHRAHGPQRRFGPFRTRLLLLRRTALKCHQEQLARVPDLPQFIGLHSHMIQLLNYLDPLVCTLI